MKRTTQDTDRRRRDLFGGSNVTVYHLLYWWSFRQILFGAITNSVVNILVYFAGHWVKGYARSALVGTAKQLCRLLMLVYISIPTDISNKQGRGNLITQHSQQHLVFFILFIYSGGYMMVLHFHFY